MKKWNMHNMYYIDPHTLTEPKNALCVVSKAFIPRAHLVISVGLVPTP